MTNFEATLREAMCRATEDPSTEVFITKFCQEGPWGIITTDEDIARTRGVLCFLVTDEGLVPDDVMDEMNMLEVPGEQDPDLERTRYLLEKSTVDVYPNEVIVNGQSF